MSVFRTIVHAFRSECGSSRAHNPWRRCSACFKRTAPSDLCIHESHVHDICIYDCVHSGNHPEGEDQ